MDLPNLLNKLKSAPDEAKKFIAIEIGFDAVKTAIWQSNGTHTEVVSIGSVQSWSSTNTDDLVTAIDTSLADTEDSGPDEPDQVIFGLPETWVDGDGIAEVRKTVLKTICQKLGLKAIGFVVTTEAMVHHLRDVEGSPPSAILLQIAATEIIVSLVYLGRLEATQVVGRSTAIAADVEEGLARIPHNGHLPSRIILFGNVDDTESIKQELISYDWQKQLEFLHFPKVESLPKEWSIKAVAIAGGSEVVESLGFANLPQSKTSSKPAEVKPPVPEEKTAVPAPVKAEAPDKPIKTETPAQPDNVPPPPTQPNTDFGFKPTAFNEGSNLQSTQLTNRFETEEFPSRPETTAPAVTIPDDIENIEAVTEPERQWLPKKSLMHKPKELLLGFGRRVKAIVNKPQTGIQMERRSGKRWIIPLLIALGVVALLAGVAYAYLNLPHATVNVEVGLKPYQQQLNFTIDPAATEVDVGNLVVPGKKQTVEKEGSKTAATTGTKTVGDRAKGQVTIYNRTTAAKSLAAGTVLKQGNVRFTLDTSVTIASASTKENSDFSLTTEPSKADAAVTSADIGEQYNVGKDTQFSVSNFATDNFVAVATSAFTGGSARKVPAVSKEDRDSLKKALIDELQSEIDKSLPPADGNTLRQVNVGEPVLASEKYSANVGEQGDNLTLEMSLAQTVYQYDASEVSLMAQQIAAGSLPQNVQLKPDSTKFNILSTAVDANDRATVSAQLVLQYIPRIETEQYAKALVGIPVNQLAAKLQTIPDYHRFELQPKLLLFNRLPMNLKHIDLYIRPVAVTE